MGTKYPKLKKGSKFTMGSSKGKLISKPKYISCDSWGLYFADVEWESGDKVKQFNICRNDIHWEGN